MKYIFISHLADESHVALQLKSLIENSFPNNCKAFVSASMDDILPGSKWLDILEKELRNANLFLA